MKVIKFIFGIIAATILLIISLIVGVIVGLILGLTAWNAGMEKFNELIKLRGTNHV